MLRKTPQHPNALSPQAWAAFMPTPAQLSSEDSGWASITARRHQHPPSGYIQPPPLAAHFIVIHLDTPGDLGVKLNGQWLRGHSQPGQISIMSANQENAWEWTSAIDSLHVCLDPQVLKRIARDIDMAGFELVDGIGLENKAIYNIGLGLLDELRGEKLGSRAYVEALTQTFCLELLRSHCNLHPDEPDERLALSPHKLKAALDFVEGHLAQNISVEDIAAAARTSHFHFAHTFRQAMGVSPYHYLLQRRIERAKVLLRETDAPISEVALATGFSSQSHFTACFHRTSQETPKRFRERSDA
ncbi:helix-turn-helix transcriptional regulator [Pseudomonas akapageensis]|uniref:helix-turn-helix transcriptional regulator n=1 Tax=Pseudomonas akapageensis TaxID=2609961 RepID=UPI00140BAD42|nr:AraC family transcriptional regulator [Pseudomonas akapageensis]